VIEKIDPGECNLARHVYPAQVFAEFDAVEGSDYAVDQDQVGQVQITVPLADMTRRFALGENVRKAFKFSGSPGGQRLNLLLVVCR